MQPIRHLAVLLAMLLTACTAPLLSTRPTPTATTSALLADSTITDTVESDTADSAAATNTPIVTVGDGTPPATTPAPINTPAITSDTLAQATTPTATTAPLASATRTSDATAATTTAADTAAALTQTAGYDNPTSPVDVIASHYNAVNLADYARAYAYWQPAPLPYADFAAGYAETASVQVIIEPPTRIEGAAGSLYAAVPTFLVAQHTDNTVHSFAGCIVTRTSNVPDPDVPDASWTIYSAQLAAVDNFASIPATLATACDQ